MLATAVSRHAALLIQLSRRRAKFRNVGRILPNRAQSRRLRLNLAESRENGAANWSDADRFQSERDHSGALLGEICPNWSEVDQFRPNRNRNRARNRPNLAGSWPKLTEECQIWADFGRVRPSHVRLKPAGMWPGSNNCGPNRVYFLRIRLRIGRLCAERGRVRARLDRRMLFRCEMGARELEFGRILAQHRGRNVLVLHCYCTALASRWRRYRTAQVACWYYTFASLVQCRQKSEYNTRLASMMYQYTFRAPNAATNTRPALLRASSALPITTEYASSTHLVNTCRPVRTTGLAQKKR